MAISLLLKSGRVVLDMIDVVKQIRTENQTTLEKAKMVARAIFTVSETLSVTGYYCDASLEKQEQANLLEIFSRMGVMVTDITNAVLEEKNPLPALIENMSSIFRITAEGGIVQEKKYLALPEEEFEKTLRPIGDLDSDGFYHITGYEPLDRQDCEDRIKNCTSLAKYTSPFELLSKEVVIDEIVDLAERFTHFCTNYRNAHVLRLIETEHLIPTIYHDDPVLARLICPITLCPIRTPLRDPTSGTIYEAFAIIQWVVANRTSPITRRPLHLEDLQQCPEEQEGINHRLGELDLL